MPISSQKLPIPIISDAPCFCLRKPLQLSIVLEKTLCLSYPGNPFCLSDFKPLCQPHLRRPLMPLSSQQTLVPVLVLQGSRDRNMPDLVPGTGLLRGRGSCWCGDPYPQALAWWGWWCFVGTVRMVVFCWHGENGGVLLTWSEWWCFVGMVRMVVFCWHGENDGVLLTWWEWW